MDWLFVVYIAAAAVAGLVIGVILHKAVVTKRLGDADGLARRIVLEARKEAQAQKKEIILQDYMVLVLSVLMQYHLDFQ